jgi:hypothetical protein
MPTDRSDQVYFRYLATAEKFDYFVLGIAVALVGYLGADLEVSKLGLSTSGLEAIAAGLFLVASISGFMRLEANISLLKVMHRRLYSEESVGALADAASSGKRVLNTSTGVALNPMEAARKHLWHRAGVEVTEDMLDSIQASSSFWYSARNGALLLGLLLLLISKVLPAYL